MLARYKHELLILLLGALLFLPFLGSVHLFDWDEINFAEAAREMIVSGNYLRVQIDFQPFWEKPPLFFWMQVGSMKLFGINEFAARFPNAICGICTLLILFRTGKKLKDTRFGWLWVMCYAGSILPQVYFKSGIIDPWFNLFIFTGLLFFIRYLQNQFPVKQLFFSGLFLGLAVLIKGPASILVLLLCFAVFLSFNKFRLFLPFKHVFLYAGFILLTLLPWVVTEISLHGTWFIWEFTKYQFQLASTGVAGHSGFFGYHFVVLFFFCFPAAVFAIPSLYKRYDQDTGFQYFRKWMLILFWVVLILFSLVQTKIIHYSSLTYFPLTFLGATTLYHLKEHWNRWISIGQVVSGLGIILVLIAIPLIVNNAAWADKLIRDPVLSLAIAGNKSAIPGIESLLGVFMCAGLITALVINYKKNVTVAMILLFSCTAIITNVTLAVFVPGIEFYSQRPMIDFFEQHKNEQAYLNVYKFKSYAQLFYGERKETDNKNPLFLSWLEEVRKNRSESADWPGPDEYRNLFTWWTLTGNIDKPAYFVVKTQHARGMVKDHPDLKLIGKDGGYLFFLREPDQ